MKICSYEISKKEFVKFIIFSIIFLTLRLSFVNSDPLYISWCKSVIFDPAIYSLNLKNYLLTGSPNIIENNYYLLFPFHYIFQKIIFFFIPYNYSSLNIISVILSFCSALFISLIMLKLYNFKYAITSLFFTSFSFVLIAYSNIFYVENTMLFFVLLSLLFFFINKNFSIFLSGFFSFIALATKINAIVIFLSIFIFFLFQKNFKKLFLFLTGFFAAAFIFFFLFFLPNYDLYKNLFSSKIYNDVIKAHSPQNFFLAFFKINNFLNSTTFLKMPILLFLSFLFFCSNLLYKNKISFFLLIWLFLSIGLINLSDYTPFRYRFIMLPIIFITATISILQFEDIELNYRKINLIIFSLLALSYFYFHFNKFVFIIIFLFVLLEIFQHQFFNYKIRFFFLVIFILYNLSYYSYEFYHKKNLILKFNKIVYDEIVLNNDYKNITIAGYGAPIFCINVPVKVINYKCVPQNLIAELNIKYIICREDEFKQLTYLKYKIIYIQYFSKYKENIYFLKLL